MNNSIRFGIVVATYQIKKECGVNTGRAKYISSPMVLTEMINSIKKQSYKNWKLYLVGDCYEDEDEVKTLLSTLLEPSQYVFFNLPKPGERNRGFSKMELRNTGGIAAMNKGLDLCEGDSVTHIVRLDHDDVWADDHLELLEAVYVEYPKLAFAFTQARKKNAVSKSNDEYMIMPSGKSQILIKPLLYLNNSLYIAGKTCHSSVSWQPSIVGRFRYRDPIEQMTTKPKNTSVIAGDMDMFRRMMKKIKTEKFKYIYIPILTVFHRNRRGEI